MEIVDDIKKIRLEKLAKIEAMGIYPYGNRFPETAKIADILKDFAEEKEVVLAGRLVANRKHGKVQFMDLQDQSGKIQIYIKEGVISAELYALVQELDIGDIVGIKGALFKTKMGQESVRVAQLQW
jgi:lysyl-tRNA synthetase class 2